MLLEVLKFTLSASSDNFFSIYRIVAAALPGHNLVLQRGARVGRQKRRMEPMLCFNEKGNDE